ncbi:MAG TPA: crosslink repair DNA glycosylase YcaQ family protein [Anaerolineae bacterium]|nr:crosslink repair DNA glycosylase YcaQ family protein [Anaerolineae bacterium]
MSSTTTPLRLSVTEARRLAVHNQALTNPMLPNNSQGILQLFRQIRCVQLDPIRAVERTHRLVLWSRLGAFDKTHLDQLRWHDRQLFEYWAHAASIVLTEDYPIFQRHMKLWRRDDSKWSRRVRDWLAANESFQTYILDTLAANGPLPSRELENRAVVSWGSSGWNDSRNVGQMLSFLWSQGDVMVAKRTGNQRWWALAADFFPDWTPREQLSAYEMTKRAFIHALRALGVATAKQIKRHFTRDEYPELTAVITDMLANGELLSVHITTDTDDSWDDDWYMLAASLPIWEQIKNGAWQPRTTLLSPFDNLICDRDRTEQLWDFHFRIEIYVPKAKRQYGYYVLPILHGDQLIGRISPKMDRKKNKLLIDGVYAEPGWDDNQLAGEAVATAVAQLAQYLQAKTITYTPDCPIPSGWHTPLTTL